MSGMLTALGIRTEEESIESDLSIEGSHARCLDTKGRMNFLLGAKRNSMVTHRNLQGQDAIAINP